MFPYELLKSAKKIHGILVLEELITQSKSSGPHQVNLQLDAIHLFRLYLSGKSSTHRTMLHLLLKNSNQTIVAFIACC